MKKFKRYILEDRFVIFIDILGFKDIVRNNKHPEKIMTALETAKKEIKNKNSDLAFYPCFGLPDMEFAEDSLFPEFFKANTDLSNLDIEDSECYIEKFRDLKVTWFSDSLILSIKSDDLNNLLFLIDIVKNLQANLFNYQILLRGAITKGELYHDDTALYGKAMIDAYLLESKKVITPRIILSKDLLNHVNDIQEEDSKKLSYNMAQSLQYDYYNNNFQNDSEFVDEWSNKETISENLLNNILIKDTDDLYFIDYLRPLLSIVSFCIGYDSSKFPEDEFQTSKDFIQSKINNDDMRISLKYIWLKKYFDKTLKNVEHEFYKSKKI